MSAPVRVYVPGTFLMLGRLHQEGSAEAPSAAAVTADLRAGLPGEDDEGLELEALLDAADVSLALIRGEREAPTRRVVIAADVPGDVVRPAPESGASAVRLSAPLAWADVVSVHVDEKADESRVRAGDLEGLSLLWYAPQEVGQLIAEATA